MTLFPCIIIAQGFTSYFTGNTTNITTVTSPGTCLMGGATENDNAMKWLLQKANGGDVVVLRTTGTNGYNNYLYTTLGININSVETLVITSVAGAVNPYVLNKIANAELIWFAGGDQFQYVSFFKDNALEDLLNNHINVKNAPIGGTSAGMAILCGKYFSAQNGSITSAQALSNPYHNNITIGQNDFLNVPNLQNTTTDTHFDNPDRKGRIMTFLARTALAQNGRSFGIASNEYVAICIDGAGKANVYGDYPNYPEFAYFIQANCQTSFLPETCVAGFPLTWNQNGEAVKTYKVPGTQTGTNFFQLSNWQTGSGGSWENWKVINGVFSSATGNPINCNLNLSDFDITKILVFPIPFQDTIEIRGFEKAKITVIETSGKIIFEGVFEKDAKIGTSQFLSGIYVIQIENEGKIMTKKVIKN